MATIGSHSSTSCSAVGPLETDSIRFESMVPVTCVRGSPKGLGFWFEGLILTMGAWSHGAPLVKAVGNKRMTAIVVVMAGSILGWVNFCLLWFNVLISSEPKLRQIIYCMSDTGRNGYEDKFGCDTKCAIRKYGR